MKKAVLDRKKADLVKRAQGLSAVIGDGDPTDEQTAQIDELRKEIDGVDTQLSHAKFFDDLTERASEQENDETTGRRGTDSTRLDRAEREWQQRCREFSLVRLCAAQIADKTGIRGPDAGREREVSTELAKRSGRDYEGVAVPTEVLDLDVRAVTEGGTGSNIITTDYRPGEYIPLLRDALVSRQLGIRVLRGLSGDVRIPKATSGVTGGWQTEAGNLPENDLVFATQLAMSPHKVGVIGQWSQRMLLQASPDIEMLFRQDIAARMARIIDGAVIEGSGTNEPHGVMENTTAESRTGDTNGKNLTTAEIQGLRVKVDNSNVGAGMRSYLCDVDLGAGAERVARYGKDEWGPILSMGQLLNVKTVVSNIVPKTTKGSKANTLTLLYGNWSDLILGYWQDLDVLVNPYESAAYKKGDVMIRVMSHADIAIRYDESFAYIDGILAVAGA